jgi:hypothetical protein
MADPKPVKTTLYNHSDGPRSVATTDGQATVIPAGGSADVEVHQGEMDDLHPDLSEDAPKAAKGKSGSPAVDASQTADLQAKAIEELATDLVKGNDLKALQALAKAEKADAADNDSPEQLALAIAQKRLGENK